MTNESSGMEQTGMSVLCQGKEPVEEQGNRVRGEEHSGRHKIEDLLALVPNARTMPQIWLDGEHLGGYDQLEAKLKEIK
jgi:glutaredoxin-related protein